MENFKYAAKRALATLVFACTGVLVGAPTLDLAVWKGALAAAIGAAINLAYRWSEAVLNSRTPAP